MKVLNYILMLVSFTIAIIFGYLNQTAQMISMIAFFVFFGLLAYIEKIEYFKLNKDGFEAKMREINRDINIIRNISSVLASTELTTLSRSGKWGGISKSEKEIVKEDLIKKLKEIGIDDNEIESNILTNWNNYTALDYYINLYNLIHAKLDGPNGRKRKEYENTFRPDETRILESIQKINKLKQFVIDSNINDDKINELFEDLEYFIKYKKHKSLERWLMK